MSFDPSKEDYCELCRSWWSREDLPDCGWIGGTIAVVRICHECLLARGAIGIGVAIEMRRGFDYTEHIRAGGSHENWPPFVELGITDCDFKRDMRRAFDKQRNPTLLADVV